MLRVNCVSPEQIKTESPCVGRLGVRLSYALLRVSGRCLRRPNCGWLLDDDYAKEHNDKDQAKHKREYAHNGRDYRQDTGAGLRSSWEKTEDAALGEVHNGAEKFKSG